MSRKSKKYTDMNRAIKRYDSVNRGAQKLLNFLKPSGVKAEPIDHESLVHRILSISIDPRLIMK